MYFLSIGLQIEPAANKFLDYGVIGAVVIFLGFICWKFYQKIDENAKEWKQQAKEMSEKYTKLHMDQNQNSRELIHIRNQDSEQNKEHQVKMEQKMDELPHKIMKEIKFQQLQRAQKSNTTSAQ